MQAELNKIKDKIINRIIAITILSITPSLLFSLLRWVDCGWQPIFITHTLLYFILIFLFLYRKKLSDGLKTHIISIVFLLVGIVGAYFYGLISSYYYVLMSIAILSILQKAKFVYYYIIAFTICYFIIGYANISHQIVPQIDANTILESELKWMSSFMGIISLSFVFVFGFGNYYKYLTEIIKESNKVEMELKRQNKNHASLNNDYLLQNKKLKAIISKADESEAKYKQLSDLTYEGIILHNNGIAIDVNYSFAKMFDYTVEELIGKNVIKLLIPKQYHSIILEKFTKNYALPYEAEGIKKNGTIFPIELEGDNIESNYSNTKTRVNAIRDISMRKKAEKDLRESEEKFRALFDNANDSIYLMRGTEIVDCNAQSLEIFGVTKEKVIGKSHADFSPELQPNGIKSIDSQTINIKKVLVGEKIIFEWEYLHSDGSIIIVDVSLNKIRFNNVDYVYAIVRDITDKKKMQQKTLKAIIQTEENERKRVAQELHDGIGPVLSTIKLFIQTYIASENNEFKKKIEDQLIISIDDALSQVSTISNNLSPHVLQDFGLKAALQKFIGRVNNVANLNIKFNYNFKKEIEKDIETTLYRVVIELANNTIKHANATEISIVIDGVYDLVQLLYTDNGKGFDFEVTKNKKMGMGLFNITNRIKSFNGQINFERGANNGIAFNIIIPAKF